MLNIVMYHYVRDLPRTAYPKIKGMLLADFRQQVDSLAEQFEMATLDVCLEYLRGNYSPKRELCLLTFDDGLKEHYREVTPILHERKIQGVFHIITASSGDKVVVPVHMNHFLMAALDFKVYSQELLDRAGVTADEAAAVVDSAIAKKTYPWDTADVANFKYYFNFVVAPTVRDAAVKALFERYIGPEQQFANELYLNWDEAREMQRAGMSLGGHTHTHRPLSSLQSGELAKELETCDSMLRRELLPQTSWAFCYPYGKPDSYNAETIQIIKKLGYDCGFTTNSSASSPGQDLFAIPRVDCKNAPAAAQTVQMQGAL